jgi:hypothetical protein
VKASVVYFFFCHVIIRYHLSVTLTVTCICRGSRNSPSSQPWRLFLVRGQLAGETYLKVIHLFLNYFTSLNNFFIFCPVKVLVAADTLFTYLFYLFQSHIYNHIHNHIHTVHSSISIRRGLSPFLHCLLLGVGTSRDSTRACHTVG